LVFLNKPRVAPDQDNVESSFLCSRSGTTAMNSVQPDHYHTCVPRFPDLLDQHLDTSLDLTFASFSAVYLTIIFDFFSCIVED
jgi:hypothetical protein